MPETLIRLGPADHGQRLRLAEFEQAETTDGRIYELGRGVVAVSDVPDRRHMLQVVAVRRQLLAYDLGRPGTVYAVLAGSECKVLVGELESERHPDLAVYKTVAPAGMGAELWWAWIPEIAIEIVSPTSSGRDYDEKPEEYLRAGIREYWILDESRRELLVRRRVGGEWRARTVRPPRPYKTRLLPGFALDLAAVFAAADQQPDALARGLLPAGASGT